MKKNGVQHSVKHPRIMPSTRTPRRSRAAQICVGGSFFWRTVAFRFGNDTVGVRSWVGMMSILDRFVFNGGTCNAWGSICVYASTSFERRLVDVVTAVPQLRDRCVRCLSLALLVRLGACRLEADRRCAIDAVVSFSDAVSMDDAASIVELTVDTLCALFSP